MPTEDGRFRGQGWSRHKEDAWTRIFGPALADDPAYEDAERDFLVAKLLPPVPSEPSPEVEPAR